MTGDYQLEFAQTAEITKRIGVLASTWCPELEVPSRDDLERMLTSLTKRGWIEGRNLVVDCVAASGRLEELPALAAGLVARRPDVLVGESTPTVRALTQARSSPYIASPPSPRARNTRAWSFFSVMACKAAI